MVILPPCSTIPLPTIYLLALVKCSAMPSTNISDKLMANSAIIEAHTTHWRSLKSAFEFTW